MSNATWDTRHWITFSLATLLTFTAGTLYIRAVLNGSKASPHVVTWSLLTIITGAATILQFLSGERIGAIPLAAATSFNATNLYMGIRRDGRSDWTPDSMICMVLALLAGYLWWQTRSGPLAALLLTVAGLVAFTPTVIRTWRYPEKEPQRIYWLKTGQYLFVTLALQEYEWQTALYPAAWVAANGLFSVYHQWRLTVASHLVSAGPP